jgi:membrane dipeptidase
MLRTLFFVALLGLSACAVSREARAHQARLKRANALLTTTPLVDTHIDFPWSLVERKEWFQPGYTGLALRHPGGEFDYERARQGGLVGAFMSIYIPSAMQLQKGRCRSMADSLITLVEQVAAAHPTRFMLAPRADDVLAAHQQGKVALPMGMENGAPIETVADVAHFYRRGIRYVTLTHNRDNQICDSSRDSSRTNQGLSPFGYQVVAEMNRLGMMVDVSHLSDEAISDVLGTVRKPVVASHSACRHMTPGFQRNLPDSLIVAIARQGGVIQVPFSHYFLSTESRQEFDQAEKKMKNKGLSDDSKPEARAFMRKELTRLNTSVRTVADQIDYIRRLVGIDHVGLGSDFDGVGLALPPDLADVSMYPNLLAELYRRGYSDADVRKVCSDNLLRVWRANEKGER